MAGKFQNVAYESDGTSPRYYAIRVQPETIALTIDGTANAASGQAVDQPISARVTGGNSQFGIKARSVSIKFTTEVPDGYAADKIYRIPVLKASTYDAYLKGKTGTYLTKPIVVVGRSPERSR